MCDEHKFVARPIAPHFIATTNARVGERSAREQSLFFALLTRRRYGVKRDGRATNSRGETSLHIDLNVFFFNSKTVDISK